MITGVAVTIFAIYFATLFLVPLKLDPKRIDKLINSIEGKEHSIISWTFFHPDHKGPINQRYYKVRYTDKNEKIHFAEMLVSSMSPLSIVKDKIVDAKEPAERKYDFEKA